MATLAAHLVELPRAEGAALVGRPEDHRCGRAGRRQHLLRREVLGVVADPAAAQHGAVVAAGARQDGLVQGQLRGRSRSSSTGRSESATLRRGVELGPEAAVGAVEGGSVLDDHADVRPPRAVSVRSSRAQRAASVWPEGPSGPSGRVSATASARSHVGWPRNAASVVGRSASAIGWPAASAASTTGTSWASRSTSVS